MVRAHAGTSSGHAETFGKMTAGENLERGRGPWARGGPRSSGGSLGKTQVLAHVGARSSLCRRGQTGTDGDSRQSSGQSDPRAGRCGRTGGSQAAGAVIGALTLTKVNDSLVVTN